MKKSLVIFVIVSVGLSSLFIFRKEPKKLLVLGCARSGTKYVAEVLQKSGLNIGHERIMEDGASSWYLTAKPSYKKRRINMKKYQFEHVFHQIRHPLDLISSVYATENRHSWNYILKNLPQITLQDSHLVKCAKYWYYWNLMAEREAEWSYKVENLESQWGEFEKRLGCKVSKEGIEKPPHDIHTQPHIHDFTWADLEKELDPELFKNIKELACKYGYEVTL